MNFKVSEDGKSLQIDVPEIITRRAGERQLTLILKDGSLLRLSLRLSGVLQVQKRP